MEKNRSVFKKLFDSSHRNNTISYIIVIVIYAVCEILLKSGNMSSLFRNLLVPCACYIVAALALNLCVGISGELSLGHAGFMSIGAFTSICLSGLLAEAVPNALIRLIIAIIFGAIVSAVFGFLIGIAVLKLQGDYLAIVTLAFCQIIVSVFNNIYLGFDENGLQFSFIENRLDLSANGRVLLGGPIGASGTERTATFTVGIVLILVTLFIINNLMSSKNGRAIMAARDNRIAALSIGIDVTRIKMLSFVVSAGLAGAAGALYGLNFLTLSPAKFGFNQSILLLVYVVLGGLGNICGTIIATTLLYVLPEMLRSFESYRMIIYSLILIGIMLITNNRFFIDRINGFKQKRAEKSVYEEVK
ncbi:MAG: branched-chain amino acid ABC transporter permease [Erysipelotrichaceae bacterium]|nr:branched-chain amino acid ABC transporter permease [Erysipelotrichaceae bacterium]